MPQDVSPRTLSLEFHVWLQWVAHNQEEMLTFPMCILQSHLLPETWHSNTIVMKVCASCEAVTIIIKVSHTVHCRLHVTRRIRNIRKQSNWIYQTLLNYVIPARNMNKLELHFFQQLPTQEGGHTHHTWTWASTISSSTSTVESDFRNSQWGWLFGREEGRGETMKRMRISNFSF